MKVLRFLLRKAQDKMKQMVVKHKSDKQFMEGDLIYDKLQSYTQNSVAKGSKEKLSSKYFGPFQ